MEDPFIIKPDSYTELKPLRHGSIGKSVVYKVKGKKRKLVLKFVKCPDTKLFMSDVEILKTCVHPALSHFEGFQAPDEENNAIIANSFMVSNLEDVLNKESESPKPAELDPTQQIIITLGISAALRFLHSLNIVHKNLKPSNILLDKESKPLISDFCFTFLSKNQSNYSFDEGFSFENDIAAFGSILYELWSGEKLTSRISYGEKGKPEIKSNVPIVIANIIKKCWSDDKNRRPSAADIFQTLSYKLAEIVPDADITQTRGYLSRILDFERERLLSVLGDMQSSLNFGKSLLDTSPAPSYQVMGNKYYSIANSQNALQPVPADGNDADVGQAPKKKKLKKGKKSKKEDSDSPTSSPQSSGTKQKATKKGRKSPRPCEKPSTFTEDPFEAAKTGDLPSLRYHISQGIKPMTTNKSGQTFLHVAAQAGKVQILQYLLSLPKVLIDAKADWGRTPLHYAAESGQLEAVKFIVEQKSGSVGVVSDDGRTPLHDACGEGQLSVVDFLLKCKDIDVNKEDENGYTALHYAAESGYADVVSRLCSVKGINVNAKDMEGKTPLHYSAGEGQVKVVDVLIGVKGIDVNAKDNDGKTPLHFASLLDQQEIVEALLSVKGIDVSIKNNDGQTAADCTDNTELKSIIVKKLRK